MEKKSRQRISRVLLFWIKGSSYVCMIISQRL